jgi:hypothetical protein
MTIRTLLVLVLAVSVVGCAQQPPTTSATATVPKTVNTPHVIALQLVAGTGVAARAAVRIDVVEVGYTMTVTATNLPADSSSFVNMHTGTCALEKTDVALLIGSIAADGNGKGSVSQYFAGPYLVSAAGRILTLHGPSRTELDRSHIACVDMTS